MGKRFFILLTVIALGSLLIFPLIAQAEGVIMDQDSEIPVNATVEVAPNFGISSETVLALDAFAFVPWNQAASNALESDIARRYCSIASCILVAQVTLPSGALVTAVELDAYDNNASGYVLGSLGNCPMGELVCYDIKSVDTGSSETPGAVQVFDTLATPYTVNNRDNSYIVQTVIYGSNSDTALRAFRIFYKLQISPAPGTATFSDVPTSHPFFQYVEALADSGITAGCGGGNYCPDSPLTRGQMAVFLSKALGLHWSN